MRFILLFVCCFILSACGNSHSEGNTKEWLSKIYASYVNPLPAEVADFAFGNPDVVYDFTSSSIPSCSPYHGLHVGTEKVAALLKLFGDQFEIKSTIATVITADKKGGVVRLIYDGVSRITGKHSITEAYHKISLTDDGKLSKLVVYVNDSAIFMHVPEEEEFLHQAISAYTKGRGASIAVVQDCVVTLSGPKDSPLLGQVPCTTLFRNTTLDGKFNITTRENNNRITVEFDVHEFVHAGVHYKKAKAFAVFDLVEIEELVVVQAPAPPPATAPVPATTTTTTATGAVDVNTAVPVENAEVAPAVQEHVVELRTVRVTKIAKVEFVWLEVSHKKKAPKEKKTEEKKTEEKKTEEKKTEDKKTDEKKTKKEKGKKDKTEKSVPV